MSNQSFDERFRPIAVAELLAEPNYHFVIPSFQRGYRWERKQVIDLLDDLYSFSRGDQKSYFLQPLVVKLREDQKWEVLDGQQRLTTMLLILQKTISAKMSKEDSEEYEKALYDIEYTIRPGLSFRNPDPKTTIDGFYLSEAKATIDRWFAKKKTEHADFSNFTSGLFTRNSEKKVKFIWYEISQDSSDLNSINVFNRLNKGKIGLTSSELIKALFVLDSELRNGPNDAESGQLVMEWNEMERRFQDDRFWYVISNENRLIQTRIDLLFDFMTEKKPGDDSDYSYRQFQNLFDYCHAKHGADISLNSFWSSINLYEMSSAWRQIKSTFNTLVAWYEDNIFYHYVGFLVNEGSTPLSIYSDLQKAKKDSFSKYSTREWTRDDSIKQLKDMIREKFVDKKKHLTSADLDSLEYGNSAMVRRVLLLFNVELCIATENQRFRFDKFKMEHWDIEHVDSQNESDLQKPEERLQWLKNLVFILQREDSTSALCKECSALLKRYEKIPANELQFSTKDYQDIYRRANQYFSFDPASGDSDFESVDLSKKNKDSINNLTLLNSDINRSYKDAPFPYKRYYIIKQDMEGAHFIPIGTRNLFLKYFSSSQSSVSPLNLMRWSEEDKNQYLAHLHAVVDPIIDPK